MADTPSPGPTPGVPPARPRLRRDDVVRAAVALADEIGLEAMSMRRLAQELDVVPMALYKHVAHREALLDAMVDVIVAEIDAPLGAEDWRTAARERILSARRVLLRHRWARRALETRTAMTPAALGHLDSTIALFRAAGFSDDLTHHAMHALGSRVWGFTQELFDAPDGAPGAVPDPAPDPAVLAAMAQMFPNVAAIAAASAHDDDSVVGRGCDDQFEFEFALDVLLDGFARLHTTGWTSAGRHSSRSLAAGE